MPHSVYDSCKFSTPLTTFKSCPKPHFYLRIFESRYFAYFTLSGSWKLLWLPIFLHPYWFFCITLPIIYLFNSFIYPPFCQSTQKAIWKILKQSFLGLIDSLFGSWWHKQPGFDFFTFVSILTRDATSRNLRAQMHRQTYITHKDSCWFHWTESHPFNWCRNHSEQRSTMHSPDFLMTIWALTTSDSSLFF